MEKTLKIVDLHVFAGDKEILKGLNLTVNPGEIHALMGPNGNGKSTLLQTIMGNPAYTVSSGHIYYGDDEITSMKVDERSRNGLFLAMQYPPEISGVTNADFLRTAVNVRSKESVSVFKFAKEMDKNIRVLQMKEDLAHRFVNDGFSGGEKKRNEILQMMMLKPSLAMLDEVDSGLDVDAIKVVADALTQLFNEQAMSYLAVSHYERFFSLLKPTHAHVLFDGRIVCQGSYELVEKIDREGYDWLYEELKMEKKQLVKPLQYSLGVCAHNAGKNG